MHTVFSLILFCSRISYVCSHIFKLFQESLHINPTFLQDSFAFSLKYPQIPPNRPSFIMKVFKLYT